MSCRYQPLVAAKQQGMVLVLCLMLSSLISMMVLANLQTTLLAYKVTQVLSYRQRLSIAATMHSRQLASGLNAAACMTDCGLTDKFGHWTYRFSQLGEVPCLNHPSTPMVFYRLSLRHRANAWQQSVSQSGAGDCQGAAGFVITNGLHTFRRMMDGRGIT